MNKIQVSYVIPQFNEAESLPELVNQIRRSEKRSFEFIFIDDGSTDKSFEVLTSLKKESKEPFTIIRFRLNQGKSAAMSVGFSYAKGEYVVTLDADLQDDPAEVHKLLCTLDDGYDLAVGWRKNRQDPKQKIRSSHIFNSVVSKLSGVYLHDMNCGMKAYKIQVTKEIPMYGELHRFVPVLAAQRGFKVTEVEIVHHERKYGRSKFGKSRAVHAFFDLITTLFISKFQNNPLKIFGAAGVVLVGFGIVILMYLSALHFMGQSIGNRPLLLFGILLILFGIQVFSTGLIGELFASTTEKNSKYPVTEIIL